MMDFLNNERVQRALVSITAVVLVAGVIAFLSVRAGGDDNESRPSTTAAPATVDSTPVAKPGKLEKAARVAAGEFILAAVGREDLKKAWQLSHPDLRDQCGCTYKQWLTGNIPIQPYPVGNLDVAAFETEEASPRHAVLLVALLPKKGEKVKSQTFYIGLKASKQGDKKRWLVDYWAPYSADTAGTFAPPEG
jgi:hypothetical protein